MNKNHDLPKKFLAPVTGEVQVEALAQSYRELERKLGQRLEQKPEQKPERGKALTPQEEVKALGIPETPEQYRIEILEDYLERDLEMEVVLHQAGFTEEQVQLVYDLAAEKLVPLIMEVAQTARRATDSARLESHFGGPERWKKIKRQMQKWGQKNLPPGILETLGSTYEGVMAVHKMMAGSDEPGLVAGGDHAETLSEEQLRRMMKDPRYWRDHDPVLTKKVRLGFEQLYPKGS